MMILNAKSFTSLSSSIVSMRQNVIAIRKTVANNNKNNQKIEKKEILQQRRLDETEERRAKESANEQTKEAKKGLGKLGDKILKKPEMAFRIPGISILTATISFISFGFIGWMLKALPVIQKAVESFVEKAKEFIKSLEVFWNVIKSGFALLFNAVEGVVRQLGFGGTDGLQGGDEQKTKTLINDLVQSLNTLKDELPVRFKKFAEDLALMFAKQQAGQDITADTRTAAGASNLKQAIRRAESGEDYGAMYSRNRATFSRGQEDITKMTIDQVDQLQTDYLNHQKSLGYNSADGSDRSAAMGAYQMINVRDVALAMGLDPKTTIFSKATQDRMVDYYLNYSGFQDFKSGKITAEQFNDRLAEQFASLKTSAGRGVYDKDGMNNAYDSVLGLIQSRKFDDVSPTIDKPATVIERADDLSSGGQPKRVTIDKEVIVPITLPKERREKYQQSFAAASSIKIEVVSVDGHTFEDEIF